MKLFKWISDDYLFVILSLIKYYVVWIEFKLLGFRGVMLLLYNFEKCFVFNIDMVVLVFIR